MRHLRVSRAGLLLGTSPLLIGVVGATGCNGGDDRPRPNVILISIDTLRADHLGLYGYERETSPYLDRLADESLVFERAFAPSAWTLISHMTMLTGLYPTQHGVVDKDLALSRKTPLLAQLLRDHGYQTAGHYFEGWIHARHGFKRGFQLFEAHEDAEEAGANLTAALEKLDPERPFFLFLHLFDVHSGPLVDRPGPIYDCPPPYDELFMPDAAARLPQVPEHEIWRTPGLLDEDQLEALKALYDGGIRYVDDKLAKWIESWKATGWLDDTLLVITADHGEALGQRGNIRDHGGPYQEGIRVPLIVRFPDGMHAGARSTKTVHLADIAPTILEYVGHPGAADLPGVSLLGDLPDGRFVQATNPRNYEVYVQWPWKFVDVKHRDMFIRVDVVADPLELGHEVISQEEFLQQRERFLDSIGERPYPAAIEAEELDTEALEEMYKFGYGGEDE